MNAVGNSKQSEKRERSNRWFANKSTRSQSIYKVVKWLDDSWTGQLANTINVTIANMKCRRFQPSKCLRVVQSVELTSPQIDW